jgi:hypothetical protein
VNIYKTGGSVLELNYRRSLAFSIHIAKWIRHDSGPTVMTITPARRAEVMVSRNMIRLARAHQTLKGFLLDIQQHAPISHSGGNPL